MSLFNRRRRGQGMTEYLVLVALVAFLLIAAVQRFGYTIDEAIQGSIFAFNNRNPPPPGLNAGDVDPDTLDSSGNPLPVGKTRTGRQVFRVKAPGPGNGWEYRMDSAGGPVWSGSSGPDGPIGSP